jgi:hypothetical protein
VRVEVTDLYDAFHELAELLWQRFAFQGRRQGQPGQIGPCFDELIDQLELDLFFAACARGVWAEAEVKLDLEEIKGKLQVCDRDLNVREGTRGQYHSHGFDWSSGRETAVENLVIAGDLVGDRREDVRLFVLVDSAA